MAICIAYLALTKRLRGSCVCCERNAKCDKSKEYLLRCTMELSTIADIVQCFSVACFAVSSLSQLNSPCGIGGAIQ